MRDTKRSRRRFLLDAVRSGGALAGASCFLQSPAWLLEALAEEPRGDPLEALLATAPRARYWVSSASGDPAACSKCHDPSLGLHAKPPRHSRTMIRCLLCAQACTLAEGERGLCRARIHWQGELRTLVYGRPMTVHVDPVEKKPFYHFLPGSAAFSLATSGCPLRCKFCQNWEISQARPEDYRSEFVPAADVARAAGRRQAPIIAFTYNEPTVFTEYLTDIARAGRTLGLRSVLVSCGFMTEAPLAEMCEVLDGIKIDLKGFSPEFYRTVSSAELAPVLRSIRQIHRSGVHLEIVNLVVPTLNDSEAMLRELVAWIAAEIGPDVPVHFTRFHPDYQLRNLPPTPLVTLERARELAMDRGLHYVYVGNVPDHPGNHTYCPKCGRIVVRREGFFVGEQHVRSGACEFCGTQIAGVWT